MYTATVGTGNIFASREKNPEPTPKHMKQANTQHMIYMGQRAAKRDGDMIPKTKVSRLENLFESLHLLLGGEPVHQEQRRRRRTQETPKRTGGPSRDVPG